MQVFESFGEEYEQIVFAHDPATGMRTIIAIYSTALGPALGGTRIWPFASEEDAFRDALRLAKAMAYKASAAGLDLGGGKGVLIADSRRDKTSELLHVAAGPWKGPSIVAAARTSRRPTSARRAPTSRSSRR